jgi:hypothetical protein
MRQPCIFRNLIVVYWKIYIFAPLNNQNETTVFKYIWMVALARLNCEQSAVQIKKI